MRISELLALMGNLSVGNDNVTPFERAIFLQYLNLAHLELYQATANFNQDLFLLENLVKLQGSNSVALSRMPYLILSVYDVTYKQRLEQLSIVDAINHNPGFNGQEQAGLDTLGKLLPCQYIIQKDAIRFIPAPTGIMSVIVWYIPQPSSFTEATEEKDIPYPIAYHPVLVDGALYYLFQEEGGFKSSQKEAEAKARWEAGKSRLLSYLYASSGQTLSTFSNA